MVLRAEGPSFSAGLDRRMFTPEGIPGEQSFADLAVADAHAFDRIVASYQAAFSWLRDPSFVSVAAVQGHAVGAGFQLALACDLRVVADDVQLAMLETSLGLVPDLGGTQPLVQAVGYARALELCISGRRLGAQEAVSWGLATRAVAPADLDQATTDLVATLVAAPHRAVQETKALLQSAADNTYEEQLLAERTAQRRRIRDLAGHGGGTPGT